MIVSALLIAAALYMLCLAWDLVLLRRLAHRYANEPSRKRVAARFFTTFGIRSALQVEALNLRMQALEWSDKNRVTEVPLLPRQPKSSTNNEDIELPEGANFFTTLLDGLKDKFRSQAALVIVRRAAVERSPGGLQYFFSDQSGGLIPESRVYNCLKQLAAPFLERGDTRCFGIHDFHAVSFVLGDVSLVGVRHVLVEGFSYSDEAGIPISGAICLLYSDGKQPYAAERGSLQSICRKIEGELRSSRRIFELSGKIAEATVRDQRRSEFLAHVSHDIRSPLNNVKAILNLFSDEKLSRDLSELTNVAIANCVQVAEIVDDLLDYSRHQAGKLEPQRELIELKSCIRENVSLHAVAAKLKQLNLTVEDDNPDELIFVDLDKRHLKRVLNNLISNAIKYTRQGAIAVKIIRDESRKVKVAVSDSGIGMSREQLDLLFTPFTRFHAREADGVGLGLSLSRILVELNGGKISVASTPGIGSDFAVEFAVEFLKRKESVPVVSGETRLADSIALRVLIVDDDVESVESLARNVERSGHAALRSFSVADACENIRNCAVDCVISDYSMPEGGARVLLDCVRTTLPRMPVLILSGKSSLLAAELEKSLEGLRLLHKPCDYKIIQNWLNECAGRASGLADTLVA